MDYSKIPCETKSNCSVCQKPLGKPLISLPKLPLTEIYVSKKQKPGLGLVDQNFYICTNCGHGQLGTIVDPNFLYNKSTYFFRTSESKTAPAANDYFVNFILSNIRGSNIDTIIDIGSSDLYLLKALAGKAKKLIGIDPVLKDKESSLSKGNITVIGDFLENVDLSKLITDNTLIISSHTMEHIKDPKKMLERLFEASTPKTQFMFQFPSLEPLISDMHFDQIFNQHIQVFSKKSFNTLINNLGGHIKDMKVNYFHWGALLVSFAKGKDNKSKKIKYSTDIFERGNVLSKYGDFKARLSETNRYLRSISDGPIYGFGATLMLPILAYHLGSDLSYFESILDDDNSKWNKYYLNLPVKIENPENIKVFEDISVVVTAYNTTRSILPRILHLRPKRIILPIQLM